MDNQNWIIGEKVNWVALIIGFLAIGAIYLLKNCFL